MDLPHPISFSTYHLRMVKTRQDDLKEALTRPKAIHEILDEQINIALHEHRRANIDLFLSGISAGLEIGFSVFLMGVMYTLFAGEISESSLKLILAGSYSLGFIFVIIGRSELFTEHTTLAVLPVLNRSASIGSLLILWILIYLGNIAGGTIFSVILAKLPVALGVIDPEAFITIATGLIQFDWHLILGSGLLAGWLMGLLAWLIISSQDTFSRILIVIFITTVIGIGAPHHSIVGSIEVVTAMIVKGSEIGIADYFHFQLWTTLGNIIGGVVFVALVKFSHSKPAKRKG